MKLRFWLLLTTAAAGLVVFAMSGLFFYFYEQRADEQLVVQATHTMMAAGGRKACEAAPETWFVEKFGEDSWPEVVRHDKAGGKAAGRDEPGKGPRMPIHAHFFAYDAQLVSKNPRAPKIDSRLKAEWTDGDLAHLSYPGEKLDFLDEKLAGPHAIRPPGHGAEPGKRAPEGPPPGEKRPAGPPPDDGAHRGPPPEPSEHEGPGPGFGSDRQREPPEGMPKPRGTMIVHEMLVPMPWKDGPCAAILVKWDEPDNASGFLKFSSSIGVWGLPVLFMLLTVLLAAGPVVRRIRRLTRQVERSSTDGYRTPVRLKGRDEIGQLAQAFEKARSEIQEQMKLQQERENNLRNFLENTTHDISIPLTVLQGHLSDLAEKKGQAGPDTVGAAMTEANYLAALIGNLSIASRFETGQPTMQNEPVNLNDLVGRCVIRHRPIARQKTVSIEHAIPEDAVFAKGDVTFIEQAVNNVIFNAIRHNGKDGHVAVILESTGLGRFRISVIDDGPGIPEDQMARIAERYYRAGKERGREAGNQGLGLNIASQIACMHEWDFKLSTSEFGGLRVDFEGPVSHT